MSRIVSHTTAGLKHLYGASMAFLAGIPTVDQKCTGERLENGSGRGCQRVDKKLSISPAAFPGHHMIVMIQRKGSISAL